MNKVKKYYFKMATGISIIFIFLMILAAILLPSYRTPFTPISAIWIAMVIMLVTLQFITWDEDKLPSLPVCRKLNNIEAEWMADYFHNEKYGPDIDGYVGRYYLPEKVMEIYIKKYGDEQWPERK